MRWSVIIWLFVSGCTIQIDIADRRLTREEVKTALEQRDQALGAVVKAIKELQKNAKKTKDIK